MLMGKKEEFRNKFTQNYGPTHDRYVELELEPIYVRACVELRNYLQDFLPVEVHEISGLRLLTLERIFAENCGSLLPGSSLFPLGFLVIATSIGGNVICVDMASGIVYWFDREVSLAGEYADYYNPLEGRWIRAIVAREALPAVMVQLEKDLGSFLVKLVEEKYEELIEDLD